MVSVITGLQGIFCNQRQYFLQIIPGNGGHIFGSGANILINKRK
jgi:hypothetical protein